MVLEPAALIDVRGEIAPRHAKRFPDRIVDDVSEPLGVGAAIGFLAEPIGDACRARDRT